MWRSRTAVAGAMLPVVIAIVMVMLVVLAVLAAGAVAQDGGPRWQPADYHDGHARPRVLAFNRDDGLLYAALSTADAVLVIDVSAPAAPRVIARLTVCRFPDALAAAPGGGVVVACRFDPSLRRLARDTGTKWTSTAIDAGPEAGARGLALDPSGGGTGVIYVASPPVRGVKVVSLSGGGVRQVVPTGISPRALRFVPQATFPGQRRPLLLVSNFVDHTVTVHVVDPDGSLEPASQTIAVEAPVLDLLPAPGPAPALLLFSHEDRPLSRANGPVEGLDSGVLRLEAASVVGSPFRDPGPGARAFVNTSARAPEPVVELGAAARDPETGAIAVAGAGTDNLLIAAAPGDDAALGRARAVTVGANPSAVVALPGRRWVTADRLSDTLTFVGPAGAAGAPAVQATLAVGNARRPSLAERGEVLFHSRALVPNNVADGPLSLYTCAACHDDGHIDGRRHPSKRNRFFSMTKTCRGLGTTAPYLSLGEPDTIEGFADNIVATHAQGAERDPEHFDKFPVTLRLRDGARWREIVLSASGVRAALAAYMARIPPEPSPYVAPDRRALTADERQGLRLFRGSCSGCHQLVGNSAIGNSIPAGALERRLLGREAALTSPRLYDVGTPVLGRDGNNPPSLRGVWDAAPYFSDGSARTLDEVLRRTDPSAAQVHAPANADRAAAFSPADRAALRAFLRAL